MDRGAWQATVHVVSKIWTRLSTHTLQRIFPAQGSNPSLWHWQVDSFSLSHLGSPKLTYVQFSSVAQLCLTLCDLMNHGMPGLPVHHQLQKSTQTHVH